MLFNFGSPINASLHKPNLEASFLSSTDTVNGPVPIEEKVICPSLVSGGRCRVDAAMGEDSSQGIIVVDGRERRSAEDWISHVAR